ncbi:hypothetical protein LX36DRAFT_365644 [Colletotrichum falcatum]|nr:hypothetical protein LX36DRAFT_365644 [Colletotrichum falcatum]
MYLHGAENLVRHTIAPRRRGGPLSHLRRDLPGTHAYLDLPRTSIIPVCVFFVLFTCFFYPFLARLWPDKYSPILSRNSQSRTGMPGMDHLLLEDGRRPPSPHPPYPSPSPSPGYSITCR